MFKQLVLWSCAGGFVVAHPGGLRAEPGISSSQQVIGAGGKLYAEHCAGCHGEQGDGKGIAATFLFPKPRNFRLGRFKLVSTENNVPSEADLEAVLVRGMPGSSMPSWEHLPPTARALLTAEVLRMVADGAREGYIASLKESDDLTDEELQEPDLQQEIGEFVHNRSVAAPAVVVPKLEPSTAAAVERGKALYKQQGCAACHGNEGKGDGVQQMVEDDGFPTRPRDLTRGIYKGGDDWNSLYLRIVRGMPGTPMPSSQAITPAQTQDLIHYLLSLSTAQQRESVVLRRKSVKVPRVSTLPAGMDSASWADIRTDGIQTFPLWWRDDADPDLQMQAVHDGHTLKVRLTWKDTTQNTSAMRVDEFADMVALELFQGEAEPFVGMGTTTGLVDLWAWRAAHTSTAEDRFQMDEYPFDRPSDPRTGDERPFSEFITARAVGNQVSTRQANAASQLIAGGPGSTTFLPRPSQSVTAQAEWRAERWSVVFKRPLAAEGLALSAKCSCSVAVAIWDGQNRDRGGQKMISMWNDLELE